MRLLISYGINSKEAPKIGFYPLTNNNTSNVSANAISSFLSSISATVATTLPNSLLSTPTYTTPAYAFNTSVSVSVGGIVSSALATSTYSPIFAHSTINLTAIPTVSPSPTLETFVLTDAAGYVTTSTSSLSTASVTFGLPPGWSAGTTLRAPQLLALLTCFISSGLVLVLA